MVYKVSPVTLKTEEMALFCSAILELGVNVNNVSFAACVTVVVNSIPIKQTTADDSDDLVISDPIDKST
jgi:hypothetical protein